MSARILAQECFWIYHYLFGATIRWKLIYSYRLMSNSNRHILGSKKGNIGLTDRVNIIFKAGHGGTGAAGGQYGGPGGIGGDIILKGSEDLSMDRFSAILKKERTRSFDEIDASLVKEMRKQLHIRYNL